MRISTFFSVLALAASALAAPVVSADKYNAGLLDVSKYPQYLEPIPHDVIKAHEQLVEGSAYGSALLMFAPRVHIWSGCRSEAAVNEVGQVNEGLKNSGATDGHCRWEEGHVGQTYARGGWHNGRQAYAMTYTYYMPKDQNVAGPGNGGHRNDWEEVTVFIDDPTKLDRGEEPVLFGSAASAHGGYIRKTARELEQAGELVEDTHPNVRYFQKGVLNHQLGFFDGDGKSHPAINAPLVDWAVLPEVMKEALDYNDWGSATIKIGRAWSKKLDEAWKDEMICAKPGMEMSGDDMAMIQDCPK